MIEIKTFYFNPFRECTYVVTDTLTPGKAIVIDAGMYEEREKQRFADYINKESLTILALLITHTHEDHVCGQAWMEHTYSLSAIIQPADGTLTIDGWQEPIRVIRTPGHNPDCVCYYFPDSKSLFSGDTLFEESIGRTDLPGGNMKDLIQSLEYLKRLPNDTIVYPGHGYPTSIGHEKDYNPYL